MHPLVYSQKAPRAGHLLSRSVQNRIVPGGPAVYVPNLLRPGMARVNSMSKRVIAELLLLAAAAFVVVIPVLFAIVANRRGTRELVCPKCGWHNVRRALSKGLIDCFLVKFSYSPYRCRVCNHRFYRRASGPLHAGQEIHRPLAAHRTEY